MGVPHWITQDKMDFMEMSSPTPDVEKVSARTTHSFDCSVQLQLHWQPCHHETDLLRTHQETCLLERGKSKETAFSAREAITAYFDSAKGQRSFWTTAPSALLESWCKKSDQLHSQAGCWHPQTVREALTVVWACEYFIHLPTTEYCITSSQYISRRWNRTSPLLG